MTASPSRPDESDETIRDEALRWLLERDEGFAPARAAAFERWRRADARHAAAVERVAACLELLGDLPAAEAEIERRLAAERAARMPRSGVSLVRFAGWGLAAAAAIAVSAILVPVSRNSDNGPVPAEAPSLRVATDEASVRRQVPLEDGSILHVNAGTTLDVQLGSRQRHVTLQTGEAHFAVAPDAKRPFVVTAGSVRIRAVGTAFDVRHRDGEVDVVVHEGKVEVTSLHPDGSSSSAPILAAGERVRSLQGRVQAVESVDRLTLREALSWHGATVTFTEVPLEQVVERFNRHNDLQIVVADATLLQRRIGGTFSLDRPEALLHLLAQEGDVAIERRDPADPVVLRRK